MTQDLTVLTEFDRFASAGTMRRLGVAFARFIAQLGAASTPLVVSSALLSELEGRGHSCLPLDELVGDPSRLLDWPPERWQSLCDASGALPSTVQEWHNALAGCPQVWVVGEADTGQPLVLHEQRLYLRRYWRDERVVADAIARRAGEVRNVDADNVRTWIARLFDVMPDNAGPDWQKIACAIAVRGSFSIITGGPGTGKTYTVARLLGLLFALADDPSRLRVALAAPTGKAAARLKQSIDKALASLVPRLGNALPLAELAERVGAARTLHSLLGARPDTRAFQHHAGNPIDVDVLIVDEASMVHLEMMAALLQALPPHATLILLGDKDQLASVEAGAVLGDLCAGAQSGGYSGLTAAYVKQATAQEIPADMVSGGRPIDQRTVMLRTSRRFSGPIGLLAQAVNAGDLETAIACLRAQEEQQLLWIEQAQQNDVLRLALSGRPGAEGGYRRYLDLVREGPPANGDAYNVWARCILESFDTFRLLCAVREGDWGVSGINAAVEQALEREGLLRPQGEWYVGRPVMVTRNDYGLGVFNGDIGITLPDPAQRGSLRVCFLSGDVVRSVLATRLAQVETAFAMTVHKVQGSEFGHAVMVLPSDASLVVTRELVYTGITRASACFTLVSPVPAVLEDALKRRTRRASGLQSALT